jgi:hypothetical protein
MAVSTESRRRAAPRVAVALELTLQRAHGAPVVCRTLDLCAGGARVIANRPLRVDEELDFELSLADGGACVCGRARVLREQATSYALRFERVRDDGAVRVADLVDSATRR